jgi:hypothetical protein
VQSLPGLGVAGPAVRAPGPPSESDRPDSGRDGGAQVACELATRTGQYQWALSGSPESTSAYPAGHPGPAAGSTAEPLPTAHPPRARSCPARMGTGLTGTAQVRRAVVTARTCAPCRRGSSCGPEAGAGRRVRVGSCSRAATDPGPGPGPRPAGVTAGRGAGAPAPACGRAAGTEGGRARPGPPETCHGPSALAAPSLLLGQNPSESESLPAESRPTGVTSRSRRCKRTVPAERPSRAGWQSDRQLEARVLNRDRARLCCRFDRLDVLTATSESELSCWEQSSRKQPLLCSQQAKQPGYAPASSSESS